MTRWVISFIFQECDMGWTPGVTISDMQDRFSREDVMRSFVAFQAKKHPERVFASAFYLVPLDELLSYPLEGTA